MPFGWRADATRCRKLPLTRAILPFLNRSRAESVVYFEQEIDVTDTFNLIEELRAKHKVHVTFLHLLLMASANVIGQRPRLNRFVAGRRLWQRKGIWLTFSAKREKSDSGAVVAVKRKVEPNLSLGQMIALTKSAVADERSGKPTYVDKELGLFLAFPVFVVDIAVRLLRALDHGGWLPRSFIDNDPLFSSMFIANLGSIGLDSGFHHLFEYGNITTFCAAGEAKWVLRPDLDSDDESAVRRRRVVTLRYTFDERVEDGLYAAKSLELLRAALEAPQDHLDLSLS